MKKQKTKAMALKLIPSKKFCQVSQVSVGCTSEGSLLSQRESWSSQRANLRPPGANAQRYRQEKNPAGYETTKQFETHLLLKLRKISVEYCIYQTFLHTTGVGRDTVSLDFLNPFHLKNLLRKKKKKENEREIWLFVQYVWVSCCLLWFCLNCWMSENPGSCWACRGCLCTGRRHRTLTKPEQQKLLARSHTLLMPLALHPLHTRCTRHPPLPLSAVPLLGSRSPA